MSRDRAAQTIVPGSEQTNDGMISNSSWVHEPDVYRIEMWHGLEETMKASVLHRHEPHIRFGEIRPDPGDPLPDAFHLVVGTT